MKLSSSFTTLLLALATGISAAVAAAAAAAESLNMDPSFSTSTSTATTTATATASSTRRTLQRSPDAQPGSTTDNINPRGDYNSAAPKAGGGGENTGLILGIVAASVVALILLCSCLRWHRRVVDRDRQKKKTLSVFQYLRGMNVDDIDIRRSPAGGFHVSYLNNLAQGKNEWDEEEEEEEGSGGSNSGSQQSNSNGSHKKAGGGGAKTEETVSQGGDDDEEKKGLLASV